MRKKPAPRLALLTVSATQNANTTVTGMAITIIQSVLRTLGQKFGSFPMNR